MYDHNMSLHFPYESKNVTDEEDIIIKKYYKGYSRPFVRVGPTGHLSMAGYMDHAADIYNLEVRPDDIWVTSFSRSGTTWLQTLVWLVVNNLDYSALNEIGISQPYAYIEHPTQVAEIRKAPLDPNRPRATLEDFRTLPSLPSPRYVKSHLPLPLLPPTLLDTAKVFYIARDPRDVVVSYHFAHKIFGYFDDSVTMKEFWDLFKHDLILHTPIFTHIKEAWKARSQPNLLFLFYEDLKRDLPGSIDRVCAFLGKQYTVDQKQQLAQHLSFENMKKNTKFVPNTDNKEMSFFRKGQSGGWVQYFDEEMQKQAEEYMAKNLANTDLCFPSSH